MIESTTLSNSLLSSSVEPRLKSLAARISESIAKFSKDEQEVYFLGVNDGLESFVELDSGVSWPKDDRKNEIYDLGVNIGQAIGKLSAFSIGQDPNL